MPAMSPCYAMEIETPKHVLLNGLWVGSKTAKRVVIWVHGLAGSMFGKLSIANALVRPGIAVLIFNNRGHDNISQLIRARGPRSSNVKFAGGGAEVFKESIDDIQGAIEFARRVGAKEIYLAGYSTGAQKSVYWASRTSGGRAVNGLILLGPMSDYSTVEKDHTRRQVARAFELAKTLVAKRKPDYLLPQSIWSPPTTARRFISLYSGTSAEEIFTYWNRKLIPKRLRSVVTPVLIVLAEHDEFADRSAAEIGAWFDENISSRHHVTIIPKVGHDFRGAERLVARKIRRFMS